MVPTSVDPIFGISYPPISSKTTEQTSGKLGHRSVHPLTLVPSNALSTSVSLLSKLTRYRAFVPVSGLAWATSSLVHGMLHTISWASGVAYKEELLQSVKEAKKRAVSPTLPKTVQTVLGIFSFLRHSSPYILHTVHAATKSAEEHVATLKEACYTGMLHPNIVSNELTKIADKCAAVNHKAEQAVSSQIEPISETLLKPKAKVPRKTTAAKNTPDVTPLIDMAKILAQIGPQVVSQGTIFASMQKVGSLSSITIDTFSHYSSALFELLGKSSIASTLEATLTTGANYIELFMMLPYGKQLVSSLLKHNGLSAKQIQLLMTEFPEKLKTLEDRQEVLEEIAQCGLEALNGILFTKAATKQSHNSTFQQVLSWALPLTSWLFINSQSITVVPFLVQRVLPHLLRHTAYQIGQHANPFWLQAATHSKELLQQTSKNTEDSVTHVGSWLQFQANTLSAKVIPSTDIDPQRIKNFQNLAPHEIRHVLEITGKQATKKQISEKTIRASLRALDALSFERLLALSPTSYRCLDQIMKRRVQTVVQKYAPKNAPRPLTDQQMVEAFNKLPAEKKAEINAMTVSEFFDQSSSRQEEILFAIAHSKAYKKQLARATSNNSIQWEFLQYRALEHTTNKRLSDLLVLYSKLSEQERTLLTPDHLQKMGQAKIEHLLTIIDTYHPEFITWFKEDEKIDLRRILTTKHPLEKELLYAAFASLYNKLPVGQQLELLEMTPKECAELSSNTKQALISFLNKCGKQISSETALFKAFNSLSPLEMAQWREQLALLGSQQALVDSLIDKERTQLKAKIGSLQKRIAKATDSPEKLQLLKDFAIGSKDKIGQLERIRPHAAPAA